MAPISAVDDATVNHTEHAKSDLENHSDEMYVIISVYHVILHSDHHTQGYERLGSSPDSQTHPAPSHSETVNEETEESAITFEQAENIHTSSLVTDIPPVASKRLDAVIGYDPQEDKMPVGRVVFVQNAKESYARQFVGVLKATHDGTYHNHTIQYNTIQYNTIQYNTIQ